MADPTVKIKKLAPQPGAFDSLMRKLTQQQDALAALCEAVEHLLNQSAIYSSEKREIREQIAKAKALLGS